MNVIRIYRASDPDQTFMVDNSGASDAAEIRQLFGTDQIPTPYFGKYPAAKVVAAIRANNPGCVIVDDTAPATCDCGCGSTQQHQEYSDAYDQGESNW